MIELVGERGYGDVTVRAIARTSEVSTRSFYSHFANVGEAFASTCEWLIRCAAERTAAALRGADREQALRRGLRQLLGMIAEEQPSARLVLLDSYAAEAVVRDRARTAKHEFERLLAQLLAGLPGRAPVPDRVVEGMTAGVEAHRPRLPARRPRRRAGGPRRRSFATWILSLRDAGLATPALAPSSSTAGDGAARRDELAAALRGEAGDERARLLAAVTRLAVAEGYVGLTVPKVRAEAGVSRRSFEAHFSGTEDLFLAAIDQLIAATLADSRHLLGAGGDWDTDVERAALALCTEVARNPVVGRVALVEILAPGLEGLRRRGEVIRAIAAHLRAAAPPGRRPTQLLAEASTAAAWQILQTEVAAGREAQLPQLAPTIAYLLTRPAEAAG